MGSILSKLFGGGGNHQNHHQQQQAQPTSTSRTSSPSSTLQRPPQQLVQQQTTTPSNASSLLNRSIPIGKPLDESSSIASSIPSSVHTPPIKPRATPVPVNILEVQVDEEAFKETPLIYTSSIQAQIDQTPPHPLELYSSHKTALSITKETKITREGSSPSSAPIATLDSDIEEEIAALEAENAEIEEAVIKIQAGVRGFLVRKQINNLKSNSVDDPTNMTQQQQDTILPPPESFENSASASASADNLVMKPNLASSKKRVETPIPGSPPDNVFIAQDDTNYSILDSVDPVEAIAATDAAEELEIFKKINEINQLLAARNDDDEIEIVPEPPKSTPNLQSSPIGTAAISSTSINNALNELDQTIQEQEKKLAPEEDDEVVVIESAGFTQPKLETLLPPTPQSPSVLVKAPSLEEAEEDINSQLTEEAAAIRIQAAFRGYEVRKSLSREPSPAPADAESKPEEVTQPEVSQPEPQPPAAQPESQQLAPVNEELIPVTELADEEVIQDSPEPEPLAVQEEAKVSEIAEQEESKQEPSQPEPVKEELIQVTELSDEEVIQDPEPSFEPELKPVKEEEPVNGQPELESIKPKEEETAQIIPDVVPSATEETALMNVAIKDGFGTVLQREMAAVDIEKSIQELEKSFDRDLLSDPTCETVVNKPVEPQVAESSLISIEPATPDIQAQQANQPPVFVSSEPLLPSKIPVLDRSKSTPIGILKEPSSPEPNAYLNLALPTCVSPLSDSTTSTTANDGGDETDDEADSHTPSPIPLRASSPSPFSKKKQHRRNRNKKR